MPTPRVVIESRDFPAANAQARALREAGMDPIVCTGPTAFGAGCPLLSAEPCPVLEHADAVVFDLDLDAEADRELLRLLVVEHEGLPIFTERSVEEVRRHAASLAACTVVMPFSPAQTAERVASVLIAADG